VSLARDASADERVDPVAAWGVLGLGALDVGLIGADLTAGAQREWRSRGYGGFEAVAGGAQFAICLNQVLAAGPYDSPGAWEIGAGFGAILMVHGLVTLVAPRSHTEAPARPDTFTVAPLALSDVGRASVPGLAVLGRF
jgi:hypothetical protein